MTDALHALGDRLVGTWTTEATHPAFPGAVVAGSGRFEWLEGERFLIHRSHYDHPDIPDAISIFGDTGGLHMHYFDSRGVHRVYALTVGADGWTLLMDRAGDAPFAQRMTHTLAPGDATIAGKGQLSYDDTSWEDDLEIIYLRT